MMLPEVNLTKARNLSQWFDRAVREEQPVRIIRGRARPEIGVLIASKVLARALGVAQVHIDVVPETEWPDGGLTLIVRELPVSASGATFLEGRDALLRKVRAYVEDYFNQIDFFLRLPDKAGELPYVLRLGLARDDRELNGLLFGQATPAGAPAGAAVAR